jgi:hypothetical protein
MAESADLGLSAAEISRTLDSAHLGASRGFTAWYRAGDSECVGVTAP